MVRLLYVSATYAPGALSGSELSAHTLLRELGGASRAVVQVLTDCRYTGGVPGEGAFEGVPIRGVGHESRVQALSEAIDSFRPTAILTQLIWSDVALRIGRERGVCTILRIPALPLRLDIAHGSPFEPTVVLAPTAFVQREIEEGFGRRPFVIRSAIDLRRALVPDAQRRPRFLTMFNPIDIKGGAVFREIALRMPDRAFAAVPGWQVLRRADGSWNVELFRRSAASTGRPYDGWLPKDVDLSDVPNVTILPPREAVHEIYAVTRALLVPSQWAEVHGRVSVEAFANGIPVVASAIGGLKQDVVRAGVAVENHADPDAWVEAIRSLDDPVTYERCAERGRHVAEEFSLGRAVTEFAELLSRLATVPSGGRLDAS